MPNENSASVMHPQTDPARWFREMPRVDFDSIVGMEKQKQYLQTSIAFLDHPLRKQLCVNQPAPGYLFYGPPGVGKSMLIAAFVRGLMEKGYQYLHVSAADIQSCFVGEAEARVEQLFRTALDHAPCVVVVPELDQLCRSREDPNLRCHQHSLTNAFLGALSDVQCSGKDVVFVGETSMPWAVERLLFDWYTTLPIGYPDGDTRVRYLRQRLLPVQLAGELTPEALAEATVNFSFRQMDRIIDSIRSQLHGCIDREPALLAEVEAGRLCPTRDMLDRALARFTPRSNAACIRQLEEFERSFDLFA